MKTKQIKLQLICLLLHSNNQRILLSFPHSRIRLYKSTSRGSQLTRICTGIPEAKEILKLLGRSKSKKLFLYLRRHRPGIFDKKLVRKKIYHKFKMPLNRIMRDCNA